jgi:hypothetical protein
MPAKRKTITIRRTKRRIPIVSEIYDDQDPPESLVKARSQSLKSLAESFKRSEQDMSVEDL